jgi:FkbM family methyltransferase
LGRWSDGPILGEIATGRKPMQPLRIRLRDDDVELVVPAALSSITTYVLLEQEAWFEKELPFLRRWLEPGMTAIDIGANLGVYALPMARLVGPRGRVFAYEPGSAPRRLLEQSRDLNAASNLEVIGLALSDGEREGWLTTAQSSELSKLGDGGDGEPVRVTALDREAARFQSAPADFIKIDAEGEEERIVAGGQDIFARRSPLVMFEVKDAGGVHMRLYAMFEQMGYRMFRLLVGAPILVPFESAVGTDPFELNLFAAKPDRVASLCAKDVAVDRVPDWEPGPDALAAGVQSLKTQPFGRMFGDQLLDPARIDPDYAKPHIERLRLFAIARPPRRAIRPSRASPGRADGAAKASRPCGRWRPIRDSIRFSRPNRAGRPIRASTRSRRWAIRRFGSPPPSWSSSRRAKTTRPILPARRRGSTGCASSPSRRTRSTGAGR